jgi:hypothetical protein
MTGAGVGMMRARPCLTCNPVGSNSGAKGSGKAARIQSNTRWALQCTGMGVAREACKGLYGESAQKCSITQLAAQACCCWV